MCMIDTGARYSTLNSPLPLSKNTVPVVGFSGNTEEWPLSDPVPCKWNTLTFEHSFLLSPSCPVNLLARDIMCAQNVSLLMTPDYVDVTFPDGSVYRCATPRRAMRQMLQTVDLSDPVGTQKAEIWWGLISDFSSTPLHDIFSLWLPWISVLRLYTDPVDPPHCTFNYDLCGDENYDALWNGLWRSAINSHYASNNKNNHDVMHQSFIQSHPPLSSMAVKFSPGVNQLILFCDAILSRWRDSSPSSLTVTVVTVSHSRQQPAHWRRGIVRLTVRGTN